MIEAPWEYILVRKPNNDSVDIYYVDNAVPYKAYI
jgi:hypothetical protein